jgi:hypothetical protein
VPSSLESIRQHASGGNNLYARRAAALNMNKTSFPGRSRVAVSRLLHHHVTDPSLEPGCKRRSQAYVLFQTRKDPMKQSEIFRENAENCAHLAEAATSDPAFLRYKRMEAAWLALAEEQDWLDGEVSPTPGSVSPGGKTGSLRSSRSSR